MARSAFLTLVSTGLSAGVLVVSFLGCGSLYDDVSGGKGNCEDDGNPCTVDRCGSGAPVHEAKPDGEECALGANAGKCSEGACLLDCLTGADGMPGACNCAGDTECPTDEACATWACTAGQCARTPKPDDTIVGTLDPNDCKKEICQAGTKNTVQDDTDAPVDTMGDCQKWTCENKAPKSITDDTDLPADSQGDCQKPVCSNGVPGTSADNADEPPDTGCVNNSCLNGMVTSMNAAIGTVCTGGVCNSVGACVDCLNATDYLGCPACKVKKCDGETCATSMECKTACADTVCCNTACTDECKSCNVNNAKGTCTNIPYYEEDLAYLDPMFMTPEMCTLATKGSVCNGAGKCLKVIGKVCTVDADCVSGKCNATTPKVCLGAKGEACSSNASCISGVCNAMGACD